MAPFTRLVAAALAMNMPLASPFANPRAIPASQTSVRLSAHNSQNNGRRGFIQTIITTSIGTAVAIPSIANAASGESASIKMPNYIEYLIEKNAQGLERDDMLYKGPDPETQLRRIGEAGSRLPEIAALANDKKWSQVQGIITGPLGTLLQTMNSVASIAGTKEARDAAKVVKTDLLEIGVAAGRKESAPAVKAAEKAAKDLEKFVMVAFK
ncbi:hypothetical protein ACHAXR_009121 [Thalassiosira sp. AJA248-18]